jgi:hypothetical protein
MVAHDVVQERLHECRVGLDDQAARSGKLLVGSSLGGAMVSRLL